MLSQRQLKTKDQQDREQEVIRKTNEIAKDIERITMRAKKLRKAIADEVKDLHKVLSECDAEMHILQKDFASNSPTEKISKAQALIKVQTRKRQMTMRRLESLEDDKRLKEQIRKLDSIEELEHEDTLRHTRQVDFTALSEMLLYISAKH